MGGEDFGRYGLAGVPICMFRLGAVNQKRLDEYAAQKVPPPSLHSPVFYPDIEEALADRHSPRWPRWRWICCRPSLAVADLHWAVEPWKRRQGDR